MPKFGNKRSQSWMYSRIHMILQINGLTEIIQCQVFYCLIPFAKHCEMTSLEMKDRFMVDRV